ncbi:MAG: orotidine-5'-phosphate decarboxylase, partial [Desulfovibrio sp.]|nr:orotidine-5'-phosphate decarboxylase [Desulfovibrio sp.]
MPELIVALDLNNEKRALELAGELRQKIKWFKVGLELFVAAGPAVVLKLAEMGCRVFLDLKIYDIPNTAAAAAAQARLPGVGLFTIHLQGGERMCLAVRQALAGSGILCAGVTALTSFNQGEMPGILQPPAEYGLFLARQAHAWGLDAIVCAAGEAAKIRQPGLKLICPGIRP